VAPFTSLHDPGQRSFASDNCAGAHPEILEAIVAANGGHQPSYGDDVYTDRLRELIRHHFGENAQAYPVFNGTGANVVSLQAMTDRWESVICAKSSHLNTDECGAAERMAGIKLIPIEAPNGKLAAEAIMEEAFGWDNPHRAAPRAVSLTQTTELGTCYGPDELATICEGAHNVGMRVHVDGARLANAAATLGVGFREFTTDVGIDVVSFGGTKNGLVLGEVVVVLDPTAVRGLDHLRKSSMQLSSKMRFVSAQLVALLEEDLWIRSARHANAMARRLAVALTGVEGVAITRPVEANAVFAVLDPAVTSLLQSKFHFYVWDDETGEVRWMTAFDTTEEDVDEFAAAVISAASAL
jgi:threonine aldolase